VVIAIPSVAICKTVEWSTGFGNTRVGGSAQTLTVWQNAA